MSDAHHYRLLKYLETNPQASQRELAQILGISVGSTHYVVGQSSEIVQVVVVGWVNAASPSNLCEIAKRPGEFKFGSIEPRTATSAIASRWVKACQKCASIMGRGIEYISCNLGLKS